MAKTKTVFVCNSCGYESAKWLGKCPNCNEWNSFFEQKISNSGKTDKEEKRKNVTPQILTNLEPKETFRVSTGLEELDRVLGGGLTRGSLVLLGGEPGIRKIYLNSADL